MWAHAIRQRFLRLSGAILFITSASLTQVGYAASTEDEQWPSGHASIPGLHGVEFDANTGQGDKVSALFCAQPGGGDRLGTDVSKSPCSTTNGYTFRAVLGPCTTSRTVDCVESVSSTKGTASSVAGLFSTYFPDTGLNDYLGSASAGVPDGLPPGIWTLPGAPHEFGSDYLVSVMIAGGMANGDALKPTRSFAASIDPVSIFQTNCDVKFNGMCKDGYFEETSASGDVTIKYGGVAKDQDDGFRCANWGEASKCALRHAYPTGVKYTLKVRLRTTPSGWLHGRMQDPNASITTENGTTTVTIEAEPTRVPSISRMELWNNLPSNLQDYWTKLCPPDCGGTRIGNPQTDAPLVRNSVMSASPYSSKAFELLTVFRDFVNDKAAALPGFWKVRTFSAGEMSNAGTCIRSASGVSGIVSTNSTLYAEGPPAYNSTTKTIDYKVAAPHYEKDGTSVFKGRYNLMIRSDVARCIYKFTNAPISSTIEVIDENGAPAIAITNVSETNGWVRLDASGFSFSAPIVRVSISQSSADQTRAVLLVNNSTGSSTTGTSSNFVRTSASGAKATLTIQLSTKQKVTIYRKVGGKLTLLKTLVGKVGRNTYATSFKTTYSFVVKDARGKIIPPKLSASSYSIGRVFLW